MKKGGRHVFTVPFYEDQFLDEIRASMDSDGKIIHLKEPQYHGDPLNEKGVLVYTVFSLEMLVKLREIGFQTNMYELHKTWFGILGNFCLVFEAIKL